MPAERPSIRDLSALSSGDTQQPERAKWQTANLVGPHNEGARLVLECETSGGWPEPALTWWRDGQLVDDTYEIISQPDGLVIERLRGAGPSADQLVEPSQDIDEPDRGESWDEPSTPTGELSTRQASAPAQARLIRNRLEIAQLTRNDLLANYSCRAWNTKLAEPPSSSIMIDMNRKYPHARASPVLSARLPAQIHQSVSISRLVRPS